MADAELRRLSPVFDAMYAERGRPSIPPERLLKACLLIALYTRAQRAAVLRAARLQPAVPLVPRHGHGRGGLRRLDLRQEPAAAAARGRRAGGSSTASCGPGEGGAAALGRALHGRRDADRGVGVAQELPAPRRGAGRPAAAGRSGQPDGQLPRREALATRRTSRRRTPRRSWPARATARRPSSASRRHVADGEPQRAVSSTSASPTPIRPRRATRPCAALDDDAAGACARPRSAGTRATTRGQFVDGLRALGVTPHVAQNIDQAPRLARSTRARPATPATR